MAEKTEPPSPKKLRDAKKKGDVAFSKDANSVLTYLLGISMIFATAGGIARGFANFYRNIIDMAMTAPLHSPNWSAASGEALRLTFVLIAPVIFAIAGFGLLLSYAQVGVIFTAENMKPKLSKLNPMQQLKGWFSMKGLFEFAKTLLKLGFVFLLGYMSIKGSIVAILRLGFLSTQHVFVQLADIAKDFLFTVGAVFVGLGALDFAFQRWQWKKKLKMSKDEIKREFKEDEGDPQIKGERKQIHMEIINQDVGQAVSKADAVVVNPTHVAVTVQYTKGQMAAPKVTAKGREVLARKIISLAKKKNVPIVRDITLAWALFEVDVDDYVPRELYEAVAEVLMFAWKIRREAGDGFDSVRA